ncbi:DeoR/GlpR transcriptional regulator [Paracoccus liaowanqingii]|uniref:DeoR/GlpR transcriptional regulator n=1 Tax=Paracoccus liaowanqingii TaxID=2560053 RepID=A0A4P7HJG8_9RHOB|nr:DeoR/GlpR family DNA-binding transcription regulator [Paracoccus liaowanqingii]QBX33703.1 DeoR/GlpR transcriptional regulator [Paracoccus liaowanqingii]
MIPAERQHFILSCLAERDVVSIAELVDRLSVSHMTVRRDIQALEGAGRVSSVTGGVRLSRRLAQELPHLQKRAINTDEKRAVSRAAADLVEDGMVIYLDAGTTMLELARLIADRRGLTVVTNDLVVCAWLSEHSDCTLYHSGGLVERANQSCVGDAASEALARFNYDIAFISTSSWTISGLSSPSEAKAAVKRVAVRQARRSVLVSDSTKYGAVAAVNILALSALDSIVTDDRIDADVARALREAGAQVILARGARGIGARGLNIKKGLL